MQFSVKGYLFYKMLTSQNVSSEAQFKIFYFVEKLCSVFKIFNFCLFLTIRWFSKSVTSR